MGSGIPPPKSSVALCQHLIQALFILKHKVAISLRSLYAKLQHRAGLDEPLTLTVPLKHVFVTQMH